MTLKREFSLVLKIGLGLMLALTVSNALANSVTYENFLQPHCQTIKANETLRVTDIPKTDARGGVLTVSFNPIPMTASFNTTIVKISDDSGFSMQSQSKDPLDSSNCQLQGNSTINCNANANDLTAYITFNYASPKGKSQLLIQNKSSVPVQAYGNPVGCN